MTDEAKTRRIVQAALEWTKGTTIAPDIYEQWLLEQYSAGKISLAALTELVEERSKGTLVPVIESPTLASATGEDSRNRSG